MGIAVKFLSGALEGREFQCDGDVIRIGDSEDADVRVDPRDPGNGGVRDRLIEISRDGDGFRIQSIGGREISAQGETTIDRKVEAGEDVRFGAWGPVFALRGLGPAPKGVPQPAPKAAPKPAVPPGVGKDLRTDSGEKPVGPKTVYMMIQDALGRARTTEGGGVSKGTVFIREMVNETIHHATRSLKLGLALMAGAFVVLLGVLVFNIVSTRSTILKAASASARRVENVRSELASEVDRMRGERDGLAKEAAALAGRLAEVEKGTEGGQKAVGDVKSKIKEAEDRRRELENRMAKAMAALEKDRDSMKAELDRIQAERDAEKKARLAEEESRRPTPTSYEETSGGGEGTPVPATEQPPSDSLPKKPLPPPSDSSPK